MARIILRKIIFLLFFSIHLNNFCNFVSDIDTRNMFSLTTLSLNQTTTTTMLTINNSGKYLITDNFTASPTNNNVTCLKINTNNVFLYLNNQTITHDTTEGGTDFTAIEIASGKSNITIIGGNISSIDGTGLKIGVNCHDISIINLKINECSKIGLDIDTCNNINIENVQITNCDGSDADATQAIGLKLNKCKCICVKNSSFNHNDAASNKNSVGALLINCENCCFQDSEASSNGINANGGIVYGFSLTSTTNACLFKNCMACTNESTTNESIGFHIAYSKNNEFISCMAMSNKSTSSTAYGFYLTNATNNAFNSCKATGQETIANANHAYGFYSISGTNNMFNSCISDGNTANGDSSSIAAGFFLDENETHSSILKSCAKANNGGAGIGYGIIISGSICEISSNQIIANSGTMSGFGIKDTNASSINLYRNNFAYGNGNISETIINNYDVKPAPLNRNARFPSLISYLTDYNPLVNIRIYDNVEIIEKR